MGIRTNAAGWMQSGATAQQSAHGGHGGRWGHGGAIVGQVLIAHQPELIYEATPPCPHRPPCPPC